jgi:hypothetical protein
MKLLFTFAAAAFLASASYASAAEMPKELTGEWCPDDAAGCDPRIEAMSSRSLRSCREWVPVDHD